MNNTIATIGEKNASITYTDRPTVKAVIRKDNKILLLNDGLLPGGGLDVGETNLIALERELREELGAKVRSIEYLGQIIQYRDFLAKRYCIDAYSCQLIDFSLSSAPQDVGESAFQLAWYDDSQALNKVSESIQLLERLLQNSDAVQGKLFNLKTTRAILERVRSRNIL
jgi:8-oxo-dGTP pyrophosphatase MutT (NUDIX family)